MNSEFIVQGDNKLLNYKCTLHNVIKTMVKWIIAIFIYFMDINTWSLLLIAFEMPWLFSFSGCQLSNDQ